MHQDTAIKQFTVIFHKAGKRWPDLVAALKEAAEPDDQAQIFIDDFTKVLAKFGIVLSPEITKNLLGAFPGLSKGEHKRLNISRLYDHKYNMAAQNTYSKIDVFDDDGKEDPVDNAGYTGQNIRRKRNLLPISPQDFLHIIKADSRIQEVWQMIRKIDRERNGYITDTELDDILKIVYPELVNNNLRAVIRPHCSV